MNRISRTPSPSEIDAAASDWVLRREAGLNDSQEAEFKRWQSADPRHAAALDRAGLTWSMLDRPLRGGRADEMVQALSLRAKRRRVRQLGVACAATVAVGLFVVTALRQIPTSRPDRGAKSAVVLSKSAVVLTPEKRILPDGGTVELRPGAEITVDYTGDLRRVSLSRGEALFNVAEDKDRAFVVSAGGVEVRAVGTAFLVQFGGEQVDVVVTHGRVAVEKTAAVADTPSIAVGPNAVAFSKFVDAGERVTVGAVFTSAAPDVVRVTESEIADRLAWRSPRVEFSDTPLAEAVAVMNRYSKLQLVIDDSNLASLPVNGLFRADNTETLVRLLKASFGVESQRSGDTITLRKAR